MEKPPHVAKYVWDRFTVLKRPPPAKVKRPVPMVRPKGVSFRTLLRGLATMDLGGEGSGNFGHAGRPGEVGGSGGSARRAVFVPADYFIGKVMGAMRPDPALEVRRVPSGDRFDVVVTTKVEENANNIATAGKNVGAEVERTTVGDAHVVTVKSLAPNPPPAAPPTPAEDDAPRRGRFADAADQERRQSMAQERVQKLVPGSVTIEGKFPNFNPHFTTAANTVADVLGQMKDEGLEMPKSVRIGFPEEHGAGVQARIAGWNRKDDAGNIVRVDKDLIVEIPSTLPADVNLDDAVKATFGKPSDVTPLHAYGDRDYKTYDRFTARTMKDVIIHEMGHVQAGHRGTPYMADLLNKGTFRSTDDIRRAVMRVSEYSKTSQDEFVAEAFTRLYRGETLAEDSQKLYDALNGPKVPRR